MEHARIPCEPPERSSPLDAEGSFYPTITTSNGGLSETRGAPAYDCSNDELSASDDRLERPSNEKLLSTAFVSFMSFTLCQTVAAVIAGSEAMMGDSAAMFVDALTYLFNLLAERRKNAFDQTWEGPSDLDEERARRIKERTKRKMTLTMELVPPLVSVTTLIIVTIFVLRKAIRVLILDVHRDVSKQGDPNINLMFLFSVINLGLDCLNVFCFAKAKHLMGFETVDGEHSAASPRAQGEHYDVLDGHDLELQNESSPQYKNGDNLQCKEQYVKSNGAFENGHGRELADPPGRKESVASPTSDHSSTDSSVDSSSLCEDDEKDDANLNMCSAYTHVFADTLRSIAVIVAASIAEFVDGVTPEEADATAAVVVSGLILLSLLPLFSGLLQNFSELRAIRAEELSEGMFPDPQGTVELV